MSITHLIGTWRSVSSSIPGYSAGGETLVFSAEGPCLWIVPQPVPTLSPRQIEFVLTEQAEGYLFCPLNSSASPWMVQITRVAEDRIVVAHSGYETAFVREV